jgi:hypothetical protein
VNTNAVLQQTTLVGPANIDYMFPNVAANANGDVVIGFTRTGNVAGQFASSYALVGATSGGVVTFGSELLLKQGTALYHLFGGAGERWGDYSSVSVDPSNPNAFWVVQEWADTPVSGQSRWSTQITQLSIAAVPEPATAGILGIGSLLLLARRGRRRATA